MTAGCPARPQPGARPRIGRRRLAPRRQTRAACGGRVPVNRDKLSDLTQLKTRMPPSDSDGQIIDHHDHHDVSDRRPWAVTVPLLSH